MKDIKVAIIGLDTSHSLQFASRMQDANCDITQKVMGLRAISCLAFVTPFQDEKGIKERTLELEKLGVKVTSSFEEAVEGAEALMLEVNDPSLHVEYFEKCAKLKLPMFLDKPLADTIENGIKIYEIAKKYDAKVFSASSLRFMKEIDYACKIIQKPERANVFGALGIAMAGESVVWYGVHTFEMLQKLLGRGATSISAHQDDKGVVAIVKYNDNRRGVVELNEGAWVYGGSLRTSQDCESFTIDMSTAYKGELDQVSKFFHGGENPVDFLDTLEVMNMLDTTVKSLKSGKEELLTEI
ncbi:MAG: Gfo/Idh/MocA family oxidoreductase [Clostridia bacterium]|nr:Gfo/Idh/MocA family oxidoreductase [Clostridia bacterium]